MSELPAAGAILQHDFRPADGHIPAPKSLRLLQWNIERGYKLSGIIEELKRLDADIVALQEVDVGCDRSGGVDTGVEIARALGLNYAFFTEFEELRSPLRTPELQGGGVHGNAILTKFDFADLGLVKHATHPIDWNNSTTKRWKLEPRKGERAVLRASISVPGRPHPLIIYCAHLEVFCGALARVRHLADIFEDARSQIRKGVSTLAILGDMNTMAHGIARLSPTYCTDRLRFWSLGWSEGELWDHKILRFTDPEYELQAQAIGAARSSAAGPRIPNPHLIKWGLPSEVALAALNPGFHDPFDAGTTVTLDNPAYRIAGRSLMKGKLDWILLRGLHVRAKDMGNRDFALSDHAWLAATVDWAAEDA